MFPQADADTMSAGLHVLKKELAAGKCYFTVENEDIYLYMEALLTAEIGPVAGKRYTARLRNDVVATDLHLWL